MWLLAVFCWKVCFGIMEYQLLELLEYYTSENRISNSSRNDILANVKDKDHIRQLVYQMRKSVSEIEQLMFPYHVKLLYFSVFTILLGSYLENSKINNNMYLSPLIS